MTSSAATASVSFNEIPVALRIPGAFIEISNTNAWQGLNGLPTAILVIGQVLSAAPIALGAPVQVSSPAQAVTLCGAGSMLAEMAAAVLSSCQAWIPVWLLALADNPAGQAASGSFTIGGTAVAAGTLDLLIAGREVQVAVDAGDTPSVIATNAVAAIAAATDIPAIASAGTAGVVTLTARHKGECGNGIDLRTCYYAGEALPSGVTITITPMSGGTANPQLQTVLDGLGDAWYTDIVSPYTDAINLGAIEALGTTDYGPMVMHDTMAWTAAAGSFSALSTLGNSRNSPHVSIMGASGLPNPPWEVAATVAGVAAYNLSIDPARPLQTLALPGLLAPALPTILTMQERNMLLYDGISTFRVAPGGDGILIERCITTYKTNSAGAADPSYLDVETLRTIAFLRYDLRTYITLTFPRFKLADDGTPYGAGQAIVTPKTIRAAIVARFVLWETAGLAQDASAFQKALIVTRNAGDPNRVDALIPPTVINQLRVFAGQIQFVL
jgi:phage tail sheath gpL-like